MPENANQDGGLGVANHVEQRDFIRIRDAIGNELNGQTLKINFVPVTSESRFGAVRNGEIDLECGSFVVVVYPAGFAKHSGEWHMLC